MLHHCSVCSVLKIIVSAGTNLVFDVVACGERSALYRKAVDYVLKSESFMKSFAGLPLDEDRGILQISKRRRVGGVHDLSPFIVAGISHPTASRFSDIPAPPPPPPEGPRAFGYPSFPPPPAPLGVRHSVERLPLPPAPPPPRALPLYNGRKPPPRTSLPLPPLAEGFASTSPPEGPDAARPPPPPPPHTLPPRLTPSSPLYNGRNPPPQTSLPLPPPPPTERPPPPPTVALPPPPPQVFSSAPSGVPPPPPPFGTRLLCTYLYFPHFHGHMIIRTFYMFVQVLCYLRRTGARSHDRWKSLHVSAQCVLFALHGCTIT